MTQLIEQAFSRNEKAYCVIEESGQDLLLRELQRKNLDVVALQKSGQLAFLFPDATMRNREGHDPHALLAFYETAFYRATAQGFAGLCALGVLDSFTPPFGDSRQLVAFEALLPKAIFAPKSVSICFFCQPSLPQPLLNELIEAHPMIIQNGRLFRNSVHRTADLFLREPAETPAPVKAPLPEPAAGNEKAGTEPKPAPSQPILSPARAEPEAALPADKAVRLLKLLNACYPILFKATQERALLQDICRLLVVRGGYKAAWAGLADTGSGRLIRPVAEQGFEAGFLASLHVSWAAGSGGPAGTAVRTNLPVVLRQLATNPMTAGWQGEAQKRGFGSVAFLPLGGDELPVGLITLFAADPEAFEPDEEACLQQLGRTLGTRLLALREKAANEGRDGRREFPEAILQALGHPLALLDMNGTLLYANEDFLRAWQQDRTAGGPGPSFIDLTEQPEAGARLLREAVESGRAFGLLKRRLPDGKSADVQVDLRAVRDEMGRPVRLLAALGPDAGAHFAQQWESLEQEQTQLLEKMATLTAELKEAHDAVDRAGRTKSDFLAGMSHELRTPLNAIIGFSEVLMEPHFGSLNPKQLEYLTHILESGIHLQGLIDDILTLSKVETGSVALQPGPVALRPLLDESLALYGSRCEDQGLSLRLLVEDSAADLTLQADSARLKQVLANLLDNAVKFTPEGGQILVTARVVPNEASAQQTPSFPSPYRPPRLLQRQPVLAFPCLELVVSDSGIGVEPDYRETIFAEFFQIRNSPHHKPAGTGLGLALTRRFVNMHGGQIWVESAGTGQGSRLVCALPLPAQEPGKRES